MPTELIKQLLEAGVHFGHKSSHWNPKMAKFIFGERANIYIIDLEKTAECLSKALDFLKGIASKGETILFVGTKRQAQQVIKEEALRCSMPYVNERWVGGLLTNFSTIKRSIDRLKELEDMQQKGLFDNLSKKEIARFSKEILRLQKNFSGLKEMQNLPQTIFVIDLREKVQPFVRQRGFPFL
jgi:small subunit ribosomal protein S2